MNLEKKKEIVEELHKKLSKSKIVILTHYKGLNVEKMNLLRRKLQESEIEYQVVKNTFLTRASEDTDYSLLKEYYKGPTAIAISYEDPVAPAKVLVDFAKENEKLEIKVGVMNGKIIDFDSIKALSELPSREVLLAKVLSAMIAVPTGLVRALNDIPRKFVCVLQAIKEQKEAA